MADDKFVVLPWGSTRRDRRSTFRQLAYHVSYSTVIEYRMLLLLSAVSGFVVSRFIRFCYNSQPVAAQAKRWGET